MRSYRTKEVLEHLKGLCGAHDITQNQLVHWAVKGVVKPSIQDADGHGSYREYALQDLIKAAIAGNLVNMGISLGKLKSVFESLERKEFPDPDYAAAAAALYGYFPYRSIWEALKENPAKHQWFCITARDVVEGSSLIPGSTEFFFCADLSRLAGRTESRPVMRMADPGERTVVSSATLVNVYEALDLLKKRTGDSL